MDQLKTLLDKLQKLKFKTWLRQLEATLSPFRSQSLRAEKRLFAPVVFVVAVLWTILTAGFAVGAMVTLFCSLLVLYFIFTQVFGIDLQMIDAVVV